MLVCTAPQLLCSPSGHSCATCTPGSPPFTGLEAPKPVRRTEGSPHTPHHGQPVHGSVGGAGARAGPAQSPRQPLPAPLLAEPRA